MSFRDRFFTPKVARATTSPSAILAAGAGAAVGMLILPVAPVGAVIGQLRASGQIGSTIVIQTGTNGPVDAAVYDQIMGFLPAAEVTKVVFLTVHADRGWIAGNNQLIWALPGKYPNVSILDWDGLVASGQVPGMAGDGIHLNKASAKQFYANYIFSAIGRNDLVLPLPE